MVLAPAQSSRHSQMDVARGFGILGILWMNILVFGLPFEVMVIPAIWGEHNLANIASWEFISTFVAGVMRGMISILFGAAAYIMMKTAEASENPIEGMERFFKRLLLLIAFGLIHAYALLWPYDILYVYGLVGLFLFPFRNLPQRWLFTLGSLMLAASVFVTAQSANEILEAETIIEELFTDEELEELRESDPLIDQLGNEPSDERSSLPVAPSSPEFAHTEFVVPASYIMAQADTSSPGTEVDDETEGLSEEFEQMILSITQDIEARQQGYWSNLQSLAEESFREHTDEMFSDHFLDVGTFFIFGIFLYRSGFLTNRWATHNYLQVAIAGYLFGIAFGVLASVNHADGTALAWLSEEFGEYTFDLRRLSVALANFSMLALLVRFNIGQAITNRLAACGRMALSLYVSQTIVCNTLFLGFGFGMYGQFEHYEMILIAVALTVVQLLVAPLYLKRFGQGPLEKLLRFLVNWRPFSTQTA